MFTSEFAKLVVPRDHSLVVKEKLGVTWHLIAGCRSSTYRVVPGLIHFARRIGCVCHRPGCSGRWSRLWRFSRVLPCSQTCCGTSSERTASVWRSYRADLSRRKLRDRHPGREVVGASYRDALCSMLRTRVRSRGRSTWSATSLIASRQAVACHYGMFDRFGCQNFVRTAVLSTAGLPAFSLAATPAVSPVTVAHDSTVLPVMAQLPLGEGIIVRGPVVAATLGWDGTSDRPPARQPSEGGARPVTVLAEQSDRRLAQSAALPDVRHHQCGWPGVRFRRHHSRRPVCAQRADLGPVPRQGQNRSTSSS